jgi:hypothetical protein
MRKGRGHDDRQKTQQSNRSQERRGKMVVMAVTMMTTTTMTMKPGSDRGCGGGKWRAGAATAVALAMIGCFGNITRHPL